MGLMNFPWERDARGSAIFSTGLRHYLCPERYRIICCTPNVDTTALGVLREPKASFHLLSRTDL